MISIFFYLLSIFCVVYYGVIIAYSGLRTSFVRFWLFAAAISAFAAVFLQSSIYLSLPSIIHRIIKLFTFIILAFFLIILLKIWNTQHFCKNQEVEADYLIVPGAIVRGEKPSNALLARIQTTFYYLSAHEHTIAILTGYQNANAKISQGKCMQQELIRMGIPAYRLLVEEHQLVEVELHFHGVPVGKVHIATIFPQNLHVGFGDFIIQSQETLFVAAFQTRLDVLIGDKAQILHPHLFLCVLANVRIVRNHEVIAVFNSLQVRRNIDERPLVLSCDNNILFHF